MLKYFYPILLLLLISIGLKAIDVADSLLNKANSFYKTKQLDSAITHYKQAADIFAKEMQWGKWLKSKFSIGKSYYKKNKYEQAQNVFELCVAKANEIGGFEKEVRQYLNLIGRIQVIEGHFDLGMETFMETIDISEKNGFQDKHTAFAAKRIGLLKLRKGDYDRSYNWLHKSELIYQKNNLPQSALDVHGELGTLFLVKREFDKAAQYYQEVFENPLCKGKDKARLSINLGYKLAQDNQIKEGLKYIDDGLQIYQQNINANQRQIAEALDIKASILSQNNEWKASLETYQQAFNIAEKVFSPEHRKIALMYKNIANVWLKQSKPDSALTYYHKALSVRLNGFSNMDVTSNPDYEQLNDDPQLMKMFEFKGDAFLQKYKQSKDQKFLKWAMDNYELATFQLLQLSQFIQSDESKKDVMDSQYQLFEKAIKGALSLHEVSGEKAYKQQAIDLIQESKAITLLQDLQKAAAKKVANIPDSLLQIEQARKFQLTNKNKKLYELKILENQDDQQIAELQNEIFDLERKYEDLVQSIQSKYANYEALGGLNNQLNNKKVQSQLTAGTAFVEYFLGEKELFTILITKDQYQIFSQPTPVDLQIIVDDFRKSLTDYQYINQAGIEAEKQFLQNSHLLYQLLLEKPLQQLSETHQQLIIVPDGLLAYIPFEVLVTQATEQLNSAEYLIQKYAIDYAFSANLIKDTNTNKKRQNGFAGFAPNYDEESLTEIRTRNGNAEILYDLPEARATLREIQALYNGKAWYNEEANLDQFMKVASEYDVLHLAMHGIVDNEAPLHSRLMFAASDDNTNSSLEAIDLYNMELNAQMAVLSACNTGYGKISRGEGVMSLSRAFYYAGCPSIVMSLWSVPSQETATVMKNFYKELQQGHPKDIALQNAKIKFLENVVPKQRHPYFWSGLVTMGDNAPLKINATNSYTKWLLIGGGLLLLTLLLALLNKRKTEQS